MSTRAVNGHRFFMPTRHLRVRSLPGVHCPLLCCRHHHSPAGVRRYRPTAIVSVGRCRRPRRSRPESPATAYHRLPHLSSAELLSGVCILAGPTGVCPVLISAFWFQRFACSWSFACARLKLIEVELIDVTNGPWRANTELVIGWSLFCTAIA